MTGKEKYPTLLKCIAGEIKALYTFGASKFVEMLGGIPIHNKHALTSCLINDVYDEDFFTYLKKAELNELSRHFWYDLAYFDDETALYTKRVICIRATGYYPAWKSPVAGVGLRVLLESGKGVDGSIASGWFSIIDFNPNSIPSSSCYAYLENDFFLDNLARQLQHEINLYAQTHEIEEL